MGAATYNLKIEQGADLNLPLLLKNGDGSVMDLTGCTARLQIRRYIFDTAFLIEMSTANSRILVNLVTGSLILRLTAAETSAITACHGVYDLELVHPTAGVIRLLQGQASIFPEVTR